MMVRTYHQNPIDEMTIAKTKAAKNATVPTNARFHEETCENHTQMRA
jgi:hypothetical protein